MTPRVCSKCRAGMKLNYHAYCRGCKNQSRRDDWKRMPQWRKQQLYDEVKKCPQLIG